MSTKHKKITAGLLEIGACWAIRSDKFVDANDPYGSRAPAYHIHPDCKDPQQSAIRRFYSLNEIERYIAARKEAAAAPGDIAAMDIMEFYESGVEAR